jgi:ubiquitin related modifier 1
VCVCSGGLEILCGKKKNHEITIDDAKDEGIPMTDFLQKIKDTIIKERPDFFLQGNKVRPGILVLINDCDWELEGGLEYVVKNNDSIVFISTLHGG